MAAMLLVMLAAVTFPEHPPNWEWPDFDWSPLIIKWEKAAPKTNRTQYWAEKVKVAKAARVKRQIAKPYLEKDGKITFQDVEKRDQFAAWVEWHLKLAKIYDASPGVTPETLDQLKLRLSIQEVEALFGAPGKITRFSTSGRPPYNNRTHVIEWGSTVLQFENGSLSNF